jgi:hypothetical protein
MPCHATTRHDTVQCSKGHNREKIAREWAQKQGKNMCMPMSLSVPVAVCLLLLFCSNSIILFSCCHPSPHYPPPLPNCPLFYYTLLLSLSSVCRSLFFFLLFAACWFVYILELIREGRGGWRGGGGRFRGRDRDRDRGMLLFYFSCVLGFFSRKYFPQTPVRSPKQTNNTKQQRKEQREGKGRKGVTHKCIKKVYTYAKYNIIKEKKTLRWEGPYLHLVNRAGRSKGNIDNKRMRELSKKKKGIKTKITKKTNTNTTPAAYCICLLGA